MTQYVTGVVMKYEELLVKQLREKVERLIKEKDLELEGKKRKTLQSMYLEGRIAELLSIIDILTLQSL